MAKVQCFEDLETWQMGRDLVRQIYTVTRKGDFARDFALREQVRRAGLSICSNIAEGFERNGDREFVQFLSQAKGSCGEVRSQLYHALDETYLSESEFAGLKQQCVALSSKLSRLISYLRTSDLKGVKYKSP
jgi:four helix bundle protein